MATIQCKATTPAGQRCSKRVQEGAEFCWLHDPARKAQSRAAQAKGGVAKAEAMGFARFEDRHLKPEEVPAPPKTRREVAELLGRSITDVMCGRLTPQRGKVVQDLCRQLSRVMPADDAERPGGEQNLTDDELLVQLEQAVMQCRQRIAARKEKAA